MIGATGSRKAARKEERRSQFLGVARQLFLARGYDSTTIEAVANQVGYSKRAVYLYFETKHELFSAVLHPELVALEVRLERAVSTDDDGRGRLIAMAHEYVLFSRKRPEVFSLLMRFENHDFYRGRDCSGVLPHATACLEVNEQISLLADKVIALGLDDGSIVSDLIPAQLTIMFWASLVGILQVCSQRSAILQTHYRITSQELLSAFIHRFLPCPTPKQSD